MPSNIPGTESLARALESLRHDVLSMGSLAQENLYYAIRGLTERDTDLCNRAIADDEEVDRLEKTVDHDAMMVIMKHSPKAGDLRKVLTTIRVSNNLERVSDLAGNIAKRARKMNKHDALTEVRLVEPLYAMANHILRESIDAFAQGDMEAALRLEALDAELDKAQSALAARLTNRSQECPTQVRDFIHLLFVVRYLERIGDHAVNIAEDTVYSVSAQDIRHRTNPETPPTSA